MKDAPQVKQCCSAAGASLSWPPFCSLRLSTCSISLEDLGCTCCLLTTRSSQVRIIVARTATDCLKHYFRANQSCKVFNAACAGLSGRAHALVAHGGHGTLLPKQDGEQRSQSRFASVSRWSVSLTVLTVFAMQPRNSAVIPSGMLSTAARSWASGARTRESKRLRNVAPCASASRPATSGSSAATLRAAERTT